MTAYWKKNKFTNRTDIINKIHDIVQKSPGLSIRVNDGRIDHQTDSQNINNPWLFTNISPVRHCELWNGIYFSYFGIIPSFCRFCCWKVVVKPRTVVELFKLREIQKQLGFNSKCGVDLREYNEGPYGGFFYNDSLKEGRETLKVVKKKLRKYFGFDAPDCFLKRGCTEMEMKIPSDQWDYINEEHEEIEALLDEIFVKHESAGVQSDWQEKSKQYAWIRHAIKIGDTSWRRIVGEANVNKFIPHTVKYDSDDTFKNTKSKNGSEMAVQNG